MGAFGISSVDSRKSFLDKLSLMLVGKTYMEIYFALSCYLAWDLVVKEPKSMFLMPNGLELTWHVHIQFFFRFTLI